MAGVPSAHDEGLFSAAGTSPDHPPDPALAGEQYCYLTTTGRVTGRPHTIEIWFALEGGTLYMLAGGRERADWVRNLPRQPEVAVRIAGRELRGHARPLSAAEHPAEDALARRLLLEKYAQATAATSPSWAAHPSRWPSTSAVSSSATRAGQATRLVRAEGGQLTDERSTATSRNSHEGQRVTHVLRTWRTI